MAPDPLLDHLVGGAGAAEWVRLIAAMSERRLSRRKQDKGAFPFRRILYSHRYETPQTAFPTHSMWTMDRLFAVTMRAFMHSQSPKLPAHPQSHRRRGGWASARRFARITGRRRAGAGHQIGGVCESALAHRTFLLILRMSRSNRMAWKEGT
jgi:hypothetical protein